jgi:hypothetical protein
MVLSSTLVVASIGMLGFAIGKTVFHLRLFKSMLPVDKV